MAYFRFPYESLDRFCTDAFKAMGYTENESKIITDVLLMSDLFGIESHGVSRIIRYSKTVEKGLVDTKAKAEIIKETPVSCVIDAHKCMGQLASHLAMGKAIEKAKTTGIGISVVKNSNHYGIAGYYAKMACDEGLLGLCMTNSEAIMVPTYARKAALGSNPLAIAFPAEPYDFLFDASTTVVTRGKLEIYNKQAKPVPEGWALDATGKGSSNAEDVLLNIANKKGGGITPLGGLTELLGGHKGYGYGMLVEIFCSILSGGSTSNHTFEGDSTGICHSFIAINPDIFGNRDEIKAHFSSFLQELRDMPKAEGAERIYTHGEKEVEAEKYNRENGIPVNDVTLVEMDDIAKLCGLKLEDYLGSLEGKISKKDSIYS